MALQLEIRERLHCGIERKRFAPATCFSVLLLRLLLQIRKLLLTSEERQSCACLAVVQEWRVHVLNY